ncbi:MAG: N-acetylmuramoyl-L-alanine amidase [Clostridia bacterium]|nr:N-acetylmuramoyl-L-alanine amidase [Clostridia bacterium]
MNILLIAGHGEEDPGACLYSRREATMARELVALLQKELLKYECKCGVYNPDLSAYHQMITLGKPYDFTMYDYVLEVHFNAHKSNADGKVQGSEMYVTSGELVTTLEERILNNLAAIGFTNRGIKCKDFAVIKKAKKQGVSSALLETCFIDDEDDMMLYLNNTELVAKTIAYAIAAEYGLEKKVQATFRDTEEHWAKKDIEKVAKSGLMKGYYDGTFMPDNFVTRGELATVLSRILSK